MFFSSSVFPGVGDAGPFNLSDWLIRNRVGSITNSLLWRACEFLLFTQTYVLSQGVCETTVLHTHTHINHPNSIPGYNRGLPDGFADTQTYPFSCHAWLGVLRISFRTEVPRDKVSIKVLKWSHCVKELLMGALFSTRLHFLQNHIMMQVIELCYNDH